MSVTASRVCAIIPALDVSRSITNVLTQIYRAGVTQAVIVLNGCTDVTEITARSWLTRFPVDYRILKVESPLGPDVPKSLGTYHALRVFPQVDAFVYVDGDWLGGFGPMLQNTVHQALANNLDVQFITRSVRNSSEPQARKDYLVWNRGLKQHDPALQNLAPSEMPLLIHRRVFREISAYWLHHPGWWFALSIFQVPQGLRIGVSDTWISRFAGNPSPTYPHARKMSDTLIGDALEGSRLLQGLKPHRTWRGVLYDGYQSSRRTDLLKSWQSTLSIDV